MQNILITGGAGYIGSHMVWELLDAGEDVVVLDNLSTGFEWALPAEAAFYKGDVADRRLVRRIIKQHQVDAIIHFAGSVVVPDSIANPLGYYENNTCKSRALIAHAVECGVKHFIFSSTAAIYAAGGAEPLDEEALIAPQTPYGMSKLMVELMLRDVAIAHPLNYAVLRYFNVAGADPKGRTGQSTAGATHLIKVVCEAAAGKRGHVDVYGSDYDTPDGTCIRDYVHVCDLVDAHVLGLKWLTDGKGSRVFNLGTGKGFSVREVIDASRSVTNREVPHSEGPRRAGDATKLVSGSTRAAAELGWEPSRSTMPQMIADAWRWHQNGHYEG